MLTGLLVNGQPVNLIPGQTIYQYTAPCGQTVLGIAAAVSPQATVTVNGSAGGNFNLNISQPGVYPVDIVVSSSSGSFVSYTLEVTRPFENVLISRWDDVLAVINNPQNNGGYSFTAYQWYKDGTPLMGETRGYIRAMGGLGASSTYHVVLATTTGIHVPSCPYTPQVNVQQMSLKAYPNPVFSRQEIQVEIHLPEDEWQNAMLVMYDLLGKPVYKTRPVKGTNTINAPATGQYVLSLTVGNGVVASEKIIVKN